MNLVQAVLTIKDAVDLLKSLIFSPNIIDILTIAITFLLGGIAGFVNFAKVFHESTWTLIKSSPCLVYILFSGFITSIAYSLIIASEMKIFGFYAINHPYLLAFLIGLAGFSIIISLIPDTNTIDRKGSQGISSFIINTQSFLFHRYAVQRDKILRPIIRSAMKDIPSNRLKEFVYSCTSIISDGDQERGEKLGQKISEHFKSSLNSETLKTQVGVEVAKVMGPQIVSQVAEDLVKDFSLDENRKEALKLEAKIRELNQLIGEEVE